MSTDLAAATATLAEILATENAALAALDVTKVAAMFGEKQRVVAEFIAAQARGAPPEEAVLRRLASLADENRRLLDRAITVQGRIIGMIAQAASAPAAGYGPPTSGCHADRPVAFALCARA